MTLLVSTALLLQTAAPVSASAEWKEHIVNYLLVGLAGWVVASLRFEHRLTKSDKDHGTRMDKLEKEVAKITAEVWGPNGENGLSKHVAQLQTESHEQSRTLAEILAHVKILSKHFGTEPRDIR
jgi:hypothetical protein